MADKEKTVNKNTKIQNFKELRIWQEGIKFFKDIYLLTECFPKNELNW